MQPSHSFTAIVRHVGRTVGVLAGIVAACAAQAAAPGITGGSAGSASFDLVAAAGNISQPDGTSIYSWGYGCRSAPSGFSPTAITGKCPAGQMQLPGPTLIVTEGDTVTVNLTNNLPPAAGSTSILFPGFAVAGQSTAVTAVAVTAGGSGYVDPTTVTVVISGGGGAGATATATVDGAGVITGITITNPGTGYTSTPTVAINDSSATPGTGALATASIGVAGTGLLTLEAPNAAACQAAVHPGCNTVSYTFKANVAGTHSYYSGTQGDLQIEMGLFGALIVRPSTTPAACVGSDTNLLKQALETAQGLKRAGMDATPADYRLGKAAFNNPAACYDREYLLQTSELDPRIHEQAAAQAGLACTNPTGCMTVETEPYHPVYFLLNGRSMPDTMDPNYTAQYPNQPYNANPHLHPGELVLVRLIGQGRMQHPFHEHANHVRLLARDGQLLVNSSGHLSGPLLFTTTTSPGQALDALFQYTGKNLNWDIYGHKDADANGVATSETCTPDANGFHSNPLDNNFFEWCADHKLALESKPFGNVGSGGPVTLPDPNVLANGAWYAGSPYFGPEATGRAAGPTPIPPFGTVGNDPGSEAGYAFMWHSHNEREITTNNIFPGGLMTMMLVDPWVFLIDETK